MTHQFQQSLLDRFVATLPVHTVYQIILENDELDRTGVLGDCILRTIAEETLPQGVALVLHMINIGNACHKRRSLKLLEIEGAVTAYHLSLDRREHGGVAANTLVHQVQRLLDQPWRQGVALAAYNFDHPQEVTPTDPAT